MCNITMKKVFLELKKNTALLVATHNKKHYNGSSKSLVCLKIQPKNIIHSILVYYKRRTHTGKYLCLVINISVWLVTYYSQNKG